MERNEGRAGRGGGGGEGAGGKEQPLKPGPNHALNPKQTEPEPKTEPKTAPVLPVSKPRTNGKSERLQPIRVGWPQ